MRSCHVKLQGGEEITEECAQAHVGQSGALELYALEFTAVGTKHLLVRAFSSGVWLEFRWSVPPGRGEPANSLCHPPQESRE